MRTSRHILIQPLGFEAPVAVAAAELARYLPQVLSRYAPWIDPLIGRALGEVLGEG